MPTAPDSPEIPAEWQRWASVSLLQATPVTEVIKTVAGAGVDETAAAIFVAKLMTDPVLDAGRWAMGRLNKLGSILDNRQRLLELTVPSVEIPRRSGLTRQDFLEEFYSLNHPVLLEDVCRSWPALGRWSAEYLVEQLGDTEVEVMVGRGPGPGDEIRMDEQRTRMSFAKYTDRVIAADWTNEFYLVANNGLLGEAAAAPLWDDFELDDRYMDRSAPYSKTFLWYGPAGTVTNLHHDVMNILFHQVYGWKRVVLIPPTMTHRVSNSIGVYSDIDPVNPDLARFPEFQDIPRAEISVGPGDALFIPVGWWHHVTAMETSISISSTSFVFPNEFTWSDPSIRI